MDSPKIARRPRLAALDGLRLIAALAVLSFHYTALGGRYWGPNWVPFPDIVPVSAYGFLGVNLFFIISGFVICMSSWGRRLSDFFASRVSRLFPAYWVAVLVTASIVFLLPFPRRVDAISWLPHVSLTDVLVNLTMLQAPAGSVDLDASYWTLWRELLFYLLFAIVVWRGLTYRRTVAFCLLWTVLSVLVTQMQNSLPWSVLGPAYSPYFVAGVAMYLMHRYRPTILLAAIVVVSWILAIHQERIVLAAPVYQGLPLHRPIAYALLTACFLAVLAVALGWLDRIQWRWLTVAGALTYPLYLLHAVAGYHIIARLAPITNKYVLLAGLTVGMLVGAWLLHRLVERKGTRWLRSRMLAAVAEATNASAAQEVTGRPVIHQDPVKVNAEELQAAAGISGVVA